MTELHWDLSSLDDGCLMAILASADEEDQTKTGACAQLVSRYYAALLSVACRQLQRRLCRQPEQLAEDVVQETIVRLIDNAPQFDPTRPLRPWLWTLVKNVTANLWRRERRYRALAQGGDTLPGREPSPLDSLLPLELLERLEPPDRQLCRAFYLDQRKALEIAEASGWSVGRVYQTLHRIRTHLRTAAGHMRPAGVPGAKGGKLAGSVPDP